MEWFLEHWQDLVQIVLALLGAASLIAKLTPTKLDDKWVGKFINWVGLAKKIK